MFSKERTFGQAFGDLIREKRGQEGLTQRELAIAAFGDESRVRRIIELEGGQVDRPQAKTIDALRVYFNIKPEEMASCRRHPSFTADEEEGLGLTRALLENLAMRFEHQNPDASSDELIEHLQLKAEELRSIRHRLSLIESQDHSLNNQIATANAAIESGQFAQADDILASIEELQEQERTLVQVRRQVQIRSARADSALFQGDDDIAVSHYAKAAEYLTPFDRDEAALALEEFAGRIYDIERRRVSGNMSGALKLATMAYELTTDDTSAVERSSRAYHLALITYHAAIQMGSSGIAYLEKATVYANEALDYGGSNLMDSDWASCTMVLGNIMIRRAEVGQPAKDFSDKAVAIFDRLLNDTRVLHLGLHRAHIHNNLAAALRNLSRTVDDELSASLNTTAHTHLMKAIEISSVEGVTDVWLAAQHNLGSLLAERANRLDGEEASFARIQAISAFLSSIEIFPHASFTGRFADTQLSLGQVLLEHARALRSEISEIYMARSIAASQAAATVFDLRKSPVKWGEARFQGGIAFLAHAEMVMTRPDAESAQIAQDDIAQAIECLSSAHNELRTGSSPYAKACQEALAHAQGLASQWKSNDHAVGDPS